MMEGVQEINEVLDEIRPELIAQGGDAKLAGCDDGTVFVCLSGPLASRCQVKRKLVREIERILRARLPWIERVKPLCPPTEAQAW